MLGVQHRDPLRWMIFVDDAAKAIRHAQHRHRRYTQATVGQSLIGAGHLQQRDLPTPQSQRQAVIVAAESRNAQTPRHLFEGRDTDELQGFDGRDVV